MLKRQIAELQNYREAMAQVHELARAGRKGDAARLAAAETVAESVAATVAEAEACGCGGGSGMRRRWLRRPARTRTDRLDLFFEPILDLASWLITFFLSRCATRLRACGRKRLAAPSAGGGRSVATIRAVLHGIWAAARLQRIFFPGVLSPCLVGKLKFDYYNIFVFI